MKNVKYDCRTVHEENINIKDVQRAPTQMDMKGMWHIVRLTKEASSYFVVAFSPFPQDFGCHEWYVRRSAHQSWLMMGF